MSVSYQLGFRDAAAGFGTVYSTRKKRIQQYSIYLLMRETSRGRINSLRLGWIDDTVSACFGAIINIFIAVL